MDPIFISHGGKSQMPTHKEGAPTLPLETRNPTYRWLSTLSKTTKPKVLVVISAHWEEK
jgi:aromatic ring-opening dioxygenase catalytic subunit (LigB family)